jgi:uncharacterized protein
MKILTIIDNSLLAISRALSALPQAVCAHKKKYLFALVLITSILASGIPKIKLDMSMESFFRDHDPSLQAFNLFHYLFGGDQFLMLMFAPSDSDVFSRQSLEKLKKLEDAINKARLVADLPLNRITRVRSIISADYLTATSDSLINRKFIGNKLPRNSNESEAIRQSALAHKDYAGKLFSRDSKLGILLIQTDHGARLQDTTQANTATTQDINIELEDIDFNDLVLDASTPSGLLIQQDNLPKYETVPMTQYSVFMQEIRQLLTEHNWQLGLEQADGNATGYLAVGNPWIMDFFMSVVMSEVSIIALLSILLIIVVLYLIMGSLAATLWPTVLVIVGIVWTMGTIGWLGVTVNMMINITIFLLLAIGIAAAVHILSAFKRYTSDGLATLDALTATMAKTGLPILLAAVTTIAGLLSMTLIPITPIANFAWFSALGIVFTCALTLIFLPLLMSIWLPYKPALKKSRLQQGASKWLQSFLTWAYQLSLTQPRTIIAIFCVVAVVALAGLPRVFIDTNMITIIKPGAGLREAVTAVDQYFGGTATLEVLVDTRKIDGVKKPKLLKAIDSFSQQLLHQRADLVTDVNSIVKPAKQAYQNLTTGSEADYILTDDEQALAQTLFSFESADAATRKLFVDDAWQVARITVQVKTRGSSEYTSLTAEIKQLLEANLAPVDPKILTEVTGTIPLMMSMTDYISTAQFRTYLLVLAVIAILLLLIFGSLKFGMIAMAPNLFPIAVLLGVTGWCSIALDIDTLLVMPIAIGIAVDDSIHFLTHYRSELLAGKNSQQAIRSSLTQVGPAMIFTSIILSLGFLVFIVSVHQGLTNFGILASIAMFSALIADILLLPALLYVFKPFSADQHFNT